MVQKLEIMFIKNMRFPSWMSLDDKVSDSNASLLRRIYSEEWPTMANHVVSSGIALGAGTVTSYYAQLLLGSDAAISGLATVADVAGYWCSFLPQLAYRDRKFLFANGKLSGKGILKKTAEYLSYIGLVEGAYVIARFFAQYYLQKKGWDPATAALAVQTSMAAFFTMAWPVVRYSARKFSE